MNGLLQQLKDSLSNKISGLNYSTWFRPIESARVSGEHFTLVVPNKFIADWINDYYRELIEKELATLTRESLRLTFEVSGEALPELPPAAAAPRVRTVTQLNAKYSFGRFVVGSSNQFAHAASLAVADLPGGHYNPLYLYGGVGLGKTHLLHAIGLEIGRRHPAFTVIYVSGERFMNELINAIRFEKTPEFRRKYRDACDVLLLDDVQFIAGKERTQDEFFHTFNTLHDAQKQLVLTSDKPPKDIQGLEERLRSRFEWGLIADIQPPDLETRIAILKKKAAADRLSCPDDVAMFLASSIKSNVRELEGSLIRLNAWASLTKTPVTIDLANEVLRNLIEEGERRLSVESIQKAVASFYNVTIADLKSPRRVKIFSHPRQVAMYLCKKHAGSSFPTIGDKFGGKDHTTVIHACRKVERLLKTDSRLQNDVAALERSLLH